MPDEQFISAHVTAWPADKGQVLISNLSTGRAEVLSAPLFAILRQADRFETLSGHAKRLLEAGWEDDGSGFTRAAYQELVQRGLLVARSAFLRSILGKPGENAAPPPVTSFVVTTRDRVPQLRRCLDGFIAHNEKYGRRLDYLVMDDSRDSGQRAAVTGALAPFASRGAKIYYAGMEEKTRFVRELVRAGSTEGLPEEVVAFCLFGDESYPRSYGANRNALLLDTAGELIVMTDDDTVCQPVLLGDPEGVALTSQNDPTVLRFHGDRRELTGAVRPVDIDILSCHEKLLGRSIAGCLAGLGPNGEPELGQVGPHAVHAHGRGLSMVRATMAGYWGDSGMGSPNAAIELQGESRDLAMRSKAAYVRATSSREVSRAASQYTLSGGFLFMPINAGLDNRTLLPPFLPAGRFEDGLFALTLPVCAANTLIGHLPVGVLHAPGEPRSFPPGSFLDPAPRLGDILAAILGSFAPPPGERSTSDRLTSLGAYFTSLGGMKIGDFEEQVRGIWLATVSRYIGFLEFLLDVHHGGPVYWADDVRSLIENFKEFTLRRSPVVTRDITRGLSDDQAKECCRRLVRKFGELLQWWPVIDSATRRLREAGLRLAQPISSSG